MLVKAIEGYMHEVLFIMSLLTRKVSMHVQVIEGYTYEYILITRTSEAAV